MAMKKTYEVIISDKAKRMLGTHIKFIAQVNKEAARKKKTALKNMLGWLADSESSFLMKRKH